MVFEYYRRYFRRVFRELIDSLGWDSKTLFPALISLVLGVFLLWRFRGLQTVVDNLSDDIFLTFIPLGILAASFLIFHLIKTPAIMYEELGGFNELKLTIRVSCQQAAASEGWVTFYIHNRSASSIQSCQAALVNVTNENSGVRSLTRPGSLKWSVGHPPMEERKEIRPGEKLTVDVAHSQNELDMFRFNTWGISNELEKPGSYIAHIIVEGIYNGNNVAPYFDLRFTYKGGTKFTCDNNNQEIVLTECRLGTYD